jgi:lipoprotein signal peptidase
MAWGTKIGAYGKLFLTLFRVCAVGIGYWLWIDAIAQLLSCFYRLIFAGALGNIIDSVFTSNF